MVGNTWLTSFSRALTYQSAGQQPQDQAYQEHQDDWYDASSSSDTESKYGYDESKFDEYYNSLTANGLTPEEEAEGLKSMPSLFGEDLPPCGPNIQVAYSNVLNRLRVLWLFQHKTKSVYEICQVVRDDILNESVMKPRYSSSITNKNGLWRREDVFQYEIRWTEYFVHEAHAQEHTPMTESEIQAQRNPSSFPPSLHLDRDKVTDSVWGMWGAWHEKKWAKTRFITGTDADTGALDNVDEESGLNIESPPLNGHNKSEANDKRELKDISSSLDSNLSIISQPEDATSGVESAATAKNEADAHQ